MPLMPSVVRCIACACDMAAVPTAACRQRPLSFCPSMFIHLSIPPSFHPSIHPSIYLSTPRQCMSLGILLCIRLCICFFVSRPCQSADGQRNRFVVFLAQLRSGILLIAGA